MIPMGAQDYFLKGSKRKLTIKCMHGLTLRLALSSGTRSFYVTRSFLMVVLVTEIITVDPLTGCTVNLHPRSQGLSKKLTPFADEFNPGPLRGRG